jgi:UDP-glucose 4-epimerase
MTSSRDRPPEAGPEPAASLAVVGAAGFLGSALVRRAARDQIPCTAFTRRAPFLDPHGRPAAGLATAQTIYWLASSINPALAETQPERVVADRVTFTALLRAVVPLPHRPRVVVLSSGGTVYDPAVPPPYHEGSPIAPHGRYGEAKLDLEQLTATELAPGQGVALRVANAYGPGQPARGGQGVIAYWLRAVSLGDPITVIGDRNSTRDYVYIEDIVDALVAVHRFAGPLPATINVGSGQPTALGELAELVQKITGTARELVYRPARGFDVPHTWLDVSLAERLLGVRARTDLPTGLAATWQASRPNATID